MQSDTPFRLVIGSLSVWTIYDSPFDYPGRFVVRRWEVSGPDGRAVPDQECVLADSLEEARAAVPPGLRNLGRYPQDDINIAETWL
ncbi:MAG: hypothetical protein V4671_08355 [Armatimonadota bacterium]